ncbi:MULTISPECIES: hypothetical protein [Achromobacter]|uniref:hypothetical protein n=1 Tax=Achromobacter TaxID=222 RepID=UPI0023F95DC0|nr:hypothetical protein [Achromobacter anxifer]MDF8363338.1 hypothetical protein [Achromobacter anxifer]
MTSVLVAVDYEILRGLSPSGRNAVPLERKPVRVATMLREDAFLASGGAMKHHATVFFEDESHDWRWDEGRFWYYTRIADKADVLVVYETARVGPFSPGDWVRDFSSNQKLHKARRSMAARFVSEVFEHQLNELRSLSDESRSVAVVLESMSCYLIDHVDRLSTDWQVELYKWLASHKGFATVLLHHARQGPPTSSTTADH